MVVKPASQKSWASRELRAICCFSLLGPWNWTHGFFGGGDDVDDVDDEIEDIDDDRDGFDIVVVTRESRRME
jgi:hypothetical protein